jgi:F-type H+-transporting ATPase subunit b
MELDWSTFLLEIINFLILMWILKRFLYRPILEVIARRRQGVEKTLREAQTLRAEAEAMKLQYQRRLGDWEQEKAQAWEALQKALADERTRQSKQLDNLLAQQREKNRVLEERRLDELGHRKELAALMLAGRFTRHLLEKLAGPALEERIIALTLNELEKLSGPPLEALRSDAKNSDEAIQISTTYPVDQTGRRLIQQTLDRLWGRSARYDFHQDPSLIAGLHMRIGSRVVQANLREELQLFSEAAHANRPGAN